LSLSWTGFDEPQTRFRQTTTRTKNLIGGELDLDERLVGFPELLPDLRDPGHDSFQVASPPQSLNSRLFTY
jgi:hypothetical protein